MSYRSTTPQKRLDTAERFVEYSRQVLRSLKDDIAQGAGIDPAVVERLERTIKKHEPGRPSDSADLSGRIDLIKAIGRGRQEV